MIAGWRIFWQRSELNRPFSFLVAFALVFLLARGTAIFFGWFDGLFAGASLVSQALVLAVGLGFTAQFILRRARLRADWGDRAYAFGFRWILMPGLTLVAVAFAHVGQIEGDLILPQAVALIPLLYLLVTSLLLFFRSLMLVGMDTLTMIYVMYPEQGRLVHSDIYDVLRHPIYSAGIRLCLALALWNGSVPAVAGALIVALAMSLWVRLFEEPELIERFGEGYRTYRASVPAFFNLYPRSWPVLWRFALLGR